MSRERCILVCIYTIVMNIEYLNCSLRIILSLNAFNITTLLFVVH